MLMILEPFSWFLTTNDDLNNAASYVYIYNYRYRL